MATKVGPQGTSTSVCVCVYLMSECVCDANEKSSYSVRQGCVPGVFTQRQFGSSAVSFAAIVYIILCTCTLNFHKNMDRDILNTEFIFPISCDVSSFVMKHPRSSDFHHRDDSRARRTIVMSIYPCVYNNINILVVYTH